MPILFSAVATKNVVLSRFACCEGNFTEIADEVLSKVSQQNGKCTYFHGPYLFNYITENEHLYFCITDKTCQRSRAFLFLNQIKRRLTSEGRTGLVQILADEMYRYSEDYSTIVVRKGELEELNTIGVRSSEELLGEKLLLVKDIENLNYGKITYVAKTPKQAVLNSAEDGEDTKRVSNFENKTKTEPIQTYVHTPEMYISDNEIIYYNKSRSYMRMVVAIILLGLAIYISDFMPFGHVIVLALFVIFIIFR